MKKIISTLLFSIFSFSGASFAYECGPFDSSAVCKMVLVSQLRAQGKTVDQATLTTAMTALNDRIKTTKNGKCFTVFQIKPEKNAAGNWDWEPTRNELRGGLPKNFTVIDKTLMPVDAASVQSTEAYIGLRVIDYDEPIAPWTPADKSLTSLQWGNLRIAASGFYSKDAFVKGLGEIKTAYGADPKDVHVIDLRKECHGFVDWDKGVNYFPDGTLIADGTPILEASKDNGKNENLTLNELTKEEDDWLAGLKTDATTSKGAQICRYALLTNEGQLALSWKVNPEKPWEDKDNNEVGQLYDYAKEDPLGRSITPVFYSEETMVTGAGANYKRIPVADHGAPSPEDIDTLVNFYKAKAGADLNDPNAVFYIHCSAGKGRTSTAFIIYTILKLGNENAANSNEKLNLDELLQQVKDLRNYDLTELKKETHRKHKGFKERLRMIETFYAYRNDATDGYAAPDADKKTFTDWAYPEWDSYMNDTTNGLATGALFVDWKAAKSAAYKAAKLDPATLFTGTYHDYLDNPRWEAYKKDTVHGMNAAVSTDKQTFTDWNTARLAEYTKARAVSGATVVSYDDWLAATYPSTPSGTP